MPFPHGGTELRPRTITKKENKHGGILGIGGIFFKSATKQQVKEWYAKHLGLADSGHGDFILPWREKDNPESEQMTIWSIFPASGSLQTALSKVLLNQSSRPTLTSSAEALPIEN